MIHIHLHYKNMNIVCLYRYRDIQGIHLPCSLTYTKQIGKNTKISTKKQLKLLFLENKLYLSNK
ncbi:hypothetical protein Aargi30884_21760 [Amedibacterium intestinale]|uniref:Uncharacterized protein n=1 Tax=Amedibacterium intestinale TaxID=2583452 RepID=A0A6N4TKE6_9FIRM|nr:hypothetical protein Aargi30884_21760 [Amedibacterium intestinale]